MSFPCALPAPALRPLRATGPAHRPTRSPAELLLLSPGRSAPRKTEPWPRRSEPVPPPARAFLVVQSIQACCGPQFLFQRLLSATLTSSAQTARTPARQSRTAQSLCFRSSPAIQSDGGSAPFEKFVSREA